MVHVINGSLLTIWSHVRSTQFENSFLANCQKKLDMRAKISFFVVFSNA